MIEARNSAEALIYISEKSIKDAGDKITAEIKDSVTSKIEELKKVKEGDDIQMLLNATKTLSDEVQKIGSMMYNKDNKPDEPKNEPESDDASNSNTGGQ